MRSDVHKADQVSLIRSSLTSLSASPSGMIACKLCLNDVNAEKMSKIQQCGCQFCIDVSIIMTCLHESMVFSIIDFKSMQYPFAFKSHESACIFISNVTNLFFSA